MLWDDLDRSARGPVTQAYGAIAEAWRERYRLGTDACFRLELNGWLGQHEHRHTVGVISNIGLTGAAFSAMRVSDADQ